MYFIIVINRSFSNLSVLFLSLSIHDAGKAFVYDLETIDVYLTPDLALNNLI